VRRLRSEPPDGFRGLLGEQFVVAERGSVERANGCYIGGDLGPRG
jgi:hypothetical protein